MMYGPIIRMDDRRMPGKRRKRHIEFLAGDEVLYQGDTEESAKRDLAVKLYSVASSWVIKEETGPQAEAIFRVNKSGIGRIATPRAPAHPENVRVSLQTLVSSLYQTFRPEILVARPQTSPGFLRTGDLKPSTWEFYSVEGFGMLAGVEKADTIAAYMRLSWQVQSNEWGYFLNVREIAQGFRPGIPPQYVGQEYEILTVDLKGKRERALAAVDDSRQYMAEGIQWRILNLGDRMPKHRVLGWKLEQKRKSA